MYGTLGYGSPQALPTQYINQPLYAAKWVTFQLNAGTGNQDVSGIGFTPKVVLFFHTRQISLGSKIVEMTENIGFGISSSNRYCMTSIYSNNDVTPIAKHRISNSKVILGWDSITNTILEIADFVSLDTDGFTINISTAGSQIYVHALCLGGSEFQVASEVINVPASTGSQDYTGAGFKPDAVMALTNRLSSYDTTSGHLYRDIGFADGAMHQYNMFYRARDATTPIHDRKLHFNDALITTTGLASDTPTLRAILTAMLSNGITLDWTDVNGTPYVILLYLKGGTWDVGYFDTPAQMGTSYEIIYVSRSSEVFNMKPRMILFNGSKLSTFGSTTGINTCIGGATSADSRGCTYVHGSNVSDLTSTHMEIRSDKIFQMYDDDGVNEVASIDFAGEFIVGFIMNSTNIDETGKKISYLAWGDAVEFWIVDANYGAVSDGVTVRGQSLPTDIINGAVVGGIVTEHSGSNLWTEEPETAPETWLEKI